MAFIFTQAEITPTKDELLAAWVPTQPWAAGATGLERVGAYRFDDPDGEVGLETFLLRADDGTLLQVPLTYRGAPFDGAEAITTMEHTELGTRWVYDGCTDPAYVAALVTAVRTGGTEAVQEYDVDGERRTREPDVRVQGSGSPGTAVHAVTVVQAESGPTVTIVAAQGVEVLLARVVGALDAAGLDGAGVLTGTWAGQGEPAALAVVRDA